MLTAWILFTLFIFAMLALDLLVFHKQSHAIGYKEALIWSAVWIVLALLFCLGIYFAFGKEPALNFLAGYLIEKSLSIDNLFVFLAIFTYFSVPEQYLHKVLFWGVLGALIMRAFFIFAGIELLQHFHWIIYLFGVILIFTGIKLATAEGHEVHPENNWILSMVKKVIPITHHYVGDAFLVKREGKYWGTPLLVVLIIVESTDLLFAVDSVPAILAITQDPFIVYTSNVFAILGLRALFFALSGMMQAFRYLNYGLAALLIFIGCKMLMSHYVDIPILATLGVIAAVIGVSIAASVFIEGKT